MLNITETAARLLARGCSFFPVPAPVAGTPANSPGDGKTPRLKWREYQTRPPTAAEIDAWLHRDPSTNLAIVTGAISQLVVIDADDDAAIHWVTRTLPRTPWYVATPRGYHFYFQRPPSPIGNRAHVETPAGRFALDLRGDGGYVIAPGSLHASGDRYDAGEHFWTAPRDAVPVFDPRWVAATPTLVTSHQRRRLTPDHRAYASALSGAPNVERARRYLARVPVPRIGQGSDDATFRAAALLVREFALSADEATDVIADWVAGEAGWDRDWIAAKVAHATKYGRGAVGGYL